MNNSLSDCLRLLKILIESKRESIDPFYDLLVADYNTINCDDYIEKIENLKSLAIDGFFFCAANDVIFTNITNIKKIYGRTLEQVYPVASKTFMKLARTYWTFKAVLVECTPHDSVCFKLLMDIDTQFAGVFFPTPGLFVPSTEYRGIAMITLLSSSGANLDIKDFINGNPYLV